MSTQKSGAVRSPTDETYAEWQMAYEHFNAELFDDVLPPCLITFQREKNTMGYFSQNRFSNRVGRQTDEIALNPSYFAVCPVNEALQTLVHEMVHLWQFHYGKPGRGRYHNKEWADKMESIGLMPSSTGQPGGGRTGDKMSDYIIAGGRLESSIKRLKDKGFSLLWMDRHVARPMQTLDPYFQVVAEQAGIDIPGLERHQTELVAQDTDEIKDMIDTVELDFTRTIQKQGSRMKYSCDCGTNIWAKPGIDVTCNDCKMQFKETI